MKSWKKFIAAYIFHYFVIHSSKVPCQSFNNLHPEEHQNTYTSEKSISYVWLIFFIEKKKEEKNMNCSSNDFLNVPRLLVLILIMLNILGFSYYLNWFAIKLFSCLFLWLQVSRRRCLKFFQSSVNRLRFPREENGIVFYPLCCLPFLIVNFNRGVLIIKGIFLKMSFWETSSWSFKKLFFKIDSSKGKGWYCIVEYNWRGYHTPKMRPKGAVVR